MLTNIIFVLISFIFITFSPVSSSADCYEKVSEKYTINPAILKAIAKTESNENPYAINVNGKSIFPKTYDEASRWVNYLWAYRGYYKFDLGYMQISHRNIEAYNINPLDLLDPCYNLSWGGYILKNSFNKHGYNWKGIERYNGVNPKYPWKVYKSLISLLKNTKDD